MQTPLLLIIPLPLLDPPRCSASTPGTGGSSMKGRKLPVQGLVLSESAGAQRSVQVFPTWAHLSPLKANALCKSRNSSEHFQQLPFKGPQKEQNKTICEGEASPRQTSHFKVAAKDEQILWIIAT